MDLLQLKSMPLANLTVANAISNLLAGPTIYPQIQTKVIKTIGDNISLLSRDMFPDWPKTANSLSSIFSPDNVRNLANEVLSSPWTSTVDRKVSDLYDTSLPLSEALSRVYFENKNLSEEYSLKLFQLSSSQELSISAATTNSISANYFNTPLPLSFIRDFAPNARNKTEPMPSTPNRQPYENGKNSKKASEGLGALFQKFLRKAIQR